MPKKYDKAFKTYIEPKSYHYYGWRGRPYVHRLYSGYYKAGMAAKVYNGAINQNMQVLGHIPVGELTEDILMYAVTIDPIRALRFSPVKHVNVTKRAVGLNGLALYYVAVDDKTQELCDIACATTSKAIQFVPEKFQTEELCRKVVKDNGINLSRVTNKDIKKKLYRDAVLSNPYALQYIDKKHRTLELCKLAVKLSPNTLYYATKQDDDMCRMAVRYNSQNITYVIDKTPEMYDLAIESGGILPGHLDGIIDGLSDEYMFKILDNKGSIDKKNKKSHFNRTLLRNLHTDTDIDIYSIIEEDRFKPYAVYKCMQNQRARNNTIIYRNIFDRYAPSGTKMHIGKKISYNQSHPTYDQLLMIAKQKVFNFETLNKDNLKSMGSDKLFNVLKICIKNTPSMYSAMPKSIIQMFSKSDLAKLQKLSRDNGHSVKSNDIKLHELVKKNKFNVTILIDNIKLCDFDMSCATELIYMEEDPLVSISDALYRDAKSYGLTDVDILNHNKLFLLKMNKKFWNINNIKHALIKDKNFIHHIEQNILTIGVWLVLFEMIPHACFAKLGRIKGNKLLARSPKILKRVVAKHPEIFYMIDKPSHELTTLAITSLPENILEVDVFTKDQLLSAISKNMNIFRCLPFRYQTEDICRYAYNIDETSWYNFKPEFKELFIDSM